MDSGDRGDKDVVMKVDRDEVFVHSDGKDSDADAEGTGIDHFSNTFNGDDFSIGSGDGGCKGSGDVVVAIVVKNYHQLWFYR